MRFKDLPHKNLIATALVAIIAVMSVFFSTRSSNISFSEQRIVAQTLPNTNPDAGDIDTDQDGLPDWKEKLYGSDMEQADTDGDGTRDGDEVRIGRNPAIKNISPLGTEVSDKLSYLEDPNIATSSTDLLGIKKEFFARYLAEGSREVRESTYRDLIKTVDTQKFAPRHELLGLKISSDTSAGGIRTYVNTFGEVVKKYLNQGLKRSEDAIIEAVLSKKDKNAGAELQLLSVGYKNFSTDLLALSVPSTLAQAHLLIVNGYAGMGAGLLALSKVTADPINGTAGYEAYLKYRVDVINGYGMIVGYIANQKITFAPEEPGYPFYWNVNPPQQ